MEPMNKVLKTRPALGFPGSQDCAAQAGMSSFKGVYKGTMIWGPYGFGAHYTIGNYVLRPQLWAIATVKLNRGLVWLTTRFRIRNRKECHCFAN